MDKPIRYDMYDSRTGALVASYKSRTTATKAADKRDNAYGAIRYSVRPVWAAAA